MALSVLSVFGVFSVFKDYLHKVDQNWQKSKKTNLRTVLKHQKFEIRWKP